MSQRPEKDLAPLKPVAREFRGPLTLATLAPSGSHCTETWLKDWKKNGGQEYCLRDLRSKQDRQEVAKFNGWEKEWVAKEESYDEDKPVTKIIHDILFKISETSEPNAVSMGPAEGMHRGIAVTHVLTESKINAFTAQLKHGSLTTKDFVENGLCSQTKRPPGAVHTAVAAALDTRNDNSMLDTPITVQVTYVTNPKADAKKVLAACRRKSQGISDGKINSAKPSPSILIGDFCETYMKSIPVENLINYPDTTKDTAPIIARASASQAVKSLEKGSKTILSKFSLLDESSVQLYIKDPLDESKRKKAEIALQCEAVQSTTSEIPPLRPPFFVDYVRMATESGTLYGFYPFVVGGCSILL